MRPTGPARWARPWKDIKSRPRPSSLSCHRWISSSPSSSSSSRIAPRSITKLLEWKPDSEAKDIVVNGYVRSIRSMKSNNFVAIGDGSSLAPLQALVPAAQAEGLAIGAAVRLRGSWVPSPGTGQSHELHTQEVDVLGPSDAKTFPIQKKYQTTEYLRTMPHLRSRTPFNSALLRLRSQVIGSLTQFYADRDFVQTQPPIITSSDCEGAGEVFTVSPANEAPVPEGNTEAAESFFKSPKYLTVSTQLHLEALAQSVGNVWTLSPTFRAEKSDTSRHLSEFYMLEAEMSFVDDMAHVMDLLEDMLRHISTDLYQSKVVREICWRGKGNNSDLCPADEVEGRWKGLMLPAWPRLTYTEAINILKDKADLFEHKPVWGAGLQSEHEKYIAKVVGGGQKPVFVTHYPRDIKAFYMLPSQSSSDRSETASQLPGNTVDCFDLLVPEFCEIAGGSMREYQLLPLLEAMSKHGIVSPASALNGSDGMLTSMDSDGSPQGGGLEWYVDLRRWGCPPHGGFGLGFDRFLGYLSGVQSIRDVVAFPRWFGRCDC